MQEIPYDVSHTPIDYDGPVIVSLSIPSCTELLRSEILNDLEWISSLIVDQSFYMELYHLTHAQVSHEHRSMNQGLRFQKKIVGGREENNGLL